MNIVLICGFKRSGKDTLASTICDHYGYVHHKISTPLKDGLKAMFGLTDDQLEGDEKDVLHPSFNKTPRDIMKYVGTNMFQFEIQKFLPGVGRNFWVNKVIDRIEQLADDRRCASDKLEPTYVVVSDLRFHHELAAFRAMKDLNPSGVNLSVVKVIRTDAPRYFMEDKDDSELDHMNFS